ncbi:MAG: MFS transporter [Anaerolineae bacterium]|nr:MFS transporter [Anaerolineae bacterium]
MLGLFIISALAGLLGASADLLLAPYVLSFDSAQTLGWITAAVGAGFLAGDAVMSVWRGAVARVRFFIACEMGVGLMSALIGWSDAAWLIGLAVFVYFLLISISDATIQTVWQTKVASNFHGRVFALRDMSAIGGIVLGLLVFAPMAERVVEPLLQANGAWANTLGRVVGTGPGRGLGFVFVAMGLLNVLVLLIGYAHPRICRLEHELPDVK